MYSNGKAAQGCGNAVFGDIWIIFIWGIFLNGICVIVIYVLIHLILVNSYSFIMSE